MTVLTLDSQVSTECICAAVLADNSVCSLPPNMTADATEAGLPVTIHRVSIAESIPSTENQRHSFFNLNSNYV